MDFFKIIVSAIIYRLLPMLCGVLITRWGYNLYNKGIHLAKSGRIEAMWGDVKIAFQNAAPGAILFFSGSAIVLTSLLKGIDIEDKRKFNPEVKSLSTIVPADDTLQFQVIKEVRVDSIFEIAKMYIKTLRHLDALKELYIAKGALLTEMNDSILKAKVDSTIRVENKVLKELLEKSSQEQPIEEKRRFKVQDEFVDTTSE